MRQTTKAHWACPPPQILSVKSDYFAEEKEKNKPLEEAKEKFLAFLPEQAFREGDNDVEVYLMRKPFQKGAKIFKPHLIQ